MKIAIVSKSNKLGGGASKIAEELTLLLNQNGHYAHHYRRDLADGYTPSSTSLYGSWEFITKKIYYKLKFWGFQEIIPFELIHLLKEIKKNNYDIIHFHDISTAVSPFTLIYLSSKIPIIWTMHDCSVFTGGCITPLDCKKFQTSCFPCPQKEVWPLGGKFDLAFLYLKLKKYLHTKNIHLISPSNWLANFSTSNTIIYNKPKVIHNYVDTDKFLPLDKTISKIELNIPSERFTILLTANKISNKNKGLDYALQTLKKIKHLNPFIIIVGRIDQDTQLLFKDYDFIASGFISQEKELNLYYSAGDIFLNCTLADNLPLVVLETMASGTPMVGFSVGGIPEIVSNHQDGILVNIKDTNTLVSEIKTIWEQPKKLQKMRLKARETILKKFTANHFLNQHIKYYQSVIHT